MIDLTPIDVNIQKRLFEKMKVLGREQSTSTNTPKNGGLTHDDLATRSTFLRMTSGLTNPVILMGGELKPDGSVRSGYKDIYGPRTVYDTTLNKKNADFNWSVDEAVREGNLDEGSGPLGTEGMRQGTKNTKSTPNTFKRPMPGVKSIDVQFKGGVRALREGTISWTCWSFDDINRLMPHFLSHGTTVMIEWGWVYGQNSLNNLPTMFDENGIKRSVYKDYVNIVREGNGDFDFMVGIIKNFEFTTREDGGFDCQTIITSVGASIMDNIQPNKKSANLDTPYYNIKKTEGIREIRDKIQTSIDDGGDSLITHDIGVTMKSFIANIDNYVIKKVSDLEIQGVDVDNPQGLLSGVARNATLYSLENAWIVQFQATEEIPSLLQWFGMEQASSTPNVWVRWGWFEDNILSKFLTLVSDSKNNPIVTEFRSVETMEIPGWGNINESVRIKNHPRLETTDINKYILPGQFITFIPPADITDEDEGGEEKIKGDSPLLQKLEQIVAQNFKLFAAQKDTITLDREYGETKKIKKKRTVRKQTKGSRTFWKWDDKYEDVEEEYIFDIGEVSTPINIGKSDEGFLRNMLINTKVIKQALGVDNTDEYTVESINVREFLESLFSLLNQDINFWDFEIVQDQIETNRSKIIDTQITKFDFKSDSPKINSTGEKSKSRKSVFNSTNNEVTNNGVFFFPVWQSDSLVKRQNIIAKVPDAMAIATMYGANYDTVKSLGYPPQEASSMEASALAGAFNYYKENNPDTSLDNVEIALKKEGFETLGTLPAEDNQDKLDKEGNLDNVIAFLNTDEIKNVLKKTYQEKVDDINEQIGASNDALIDAELRKLSDPSVPLPLPNEIMRDPDLKEKFKKLVESQRGIGNQSKYAELYSSKYHNSGRMRDVFISTINTYTSFSGIKLSGQSGVKEKPLLIPLDIELDIDGIGGIIPGNSFHSTYLPKRYQEESVFQIFDVNHRLDSSGWTITLTGKMRSTMERLMHSKTKLESLDDVMTRLLKARSAQKQLDIREFEAKKENLYQNIPVMNPKVQQPGESKAQFLARQGT